MPERRTIPNRERLAETRTLPYRRSRQAPALNRAQTIPTRKRMGEGQEPTETKQPYERLKPTERSYQFLQETHRFTHPRKKKRERQPEEGNLLVDLLTLPALGVPRMAKWIGKKATDAVEQEEFDEEAIQGQLLDLQMRHELGELSVEEHDQEEAALLDRLNAIRAAKQEKLELEGKLIRRE